MNQPRAYLTIAKGNEVNRQYVLRPGQKFTIGRTFDCAISLSDKSISRRHATVEFSNRGLQIIDLGSSNGTKVDGKPLLPNQPYFIDKDDLLAVGEHVFRIQLTGLVKPDESFEATKRLPRHVVPPEEFEILGEIGRGATGVVYGALQKNLRRNVALKIPRMDADEETRKRFVLEGQLCSQVLSPYVTAIFDMRRTSNDRVYIVMELVNGGSAKDRLSQSRVPISEVAQIGEHISLGLHAIHRLKIIHRDLKPSNILLSPEGIAKLADFGIAKKTTLSKSDSACLTGSDEALGTLGYVSPEGVTGENLGPHSDIYSLGATLYHLVTHKVPFVTKEAPIPEILERILLEKPQPVHELRPDCPRLLSNLIMQMMEKDPLDRPDNTVQIALQFQKLKESYNQYTVPGLGNTDIFGPDRTDSF